ncbi:MAG TPA: efflux RND transporter periplasmic adaptor subunit [Terriglobales bacterium]|jgi:multidrug efflux system membrane fusion protein
MKTLNSRTLCMAASLAIVAAVAALEAGCAKASSDTPVVPVRTAAVTNIDTGSTNIYSANIQPYQQVDLAFQSSGYIVSIKQVRDANGHVRNIGQGDAVAQGAVLAVVQKDQYQQKLDQAKASLAKSQAEHERAKLSFDRMTVLYKAGAATQPDFDDTRAQEQSTQAAVDNANSQIAEAKLALSYCDLRAPFDSWILKRNVDLGTLVGPATNGFSLGDTRTVKAVFGVPDTAIGRIKLGSPQTVTTEALPTPFSGHVTAISAAADPKSRVYSVEVRIDNPKNLLKSGMIASIKIGTPSPAGGVMVVPISAVVRSPANLNGFAVFVTEGSGDMEKVQARDITLGNTYGNMIAVESGLQLGERVVTSGTNMIKNGDEVRVIP